MKQRTITTTLAIFIFSALLLGLTGCRSAKQLYPGEVREYQGQNLSSIADVQENNISGLQNVDTATYRLKITGLVTQPRSYTYQEILDNYPHYQKVVTLNCVEGWDATILWEGLLVKNLVDKSGALPTAKVVIFHATDGYTTSLPLDYITVNNILLAYKVNEITLPPERGFPFELVAESKWGYKWIKWVNEIELSDDVNYHGYWESRGYSNNGDLNQGY